MTGMIVAIAAITVLAALVATTHTEFVREPVARPVPISPLDEAERILSRRYAKGEIDLEQFERMLTMIRR